MICAIHQPNFIPWMPYFEKIRQADVFVFLTHCQFEKNGYQNRFNYCDKWYTMSVNHGLDNITEKQYVRHVDDWASICARLPQFSSRLNKLTQWVQSSLWQTNVDIILEICRWLGIDTNKIQLDYATEFVGTERIIDICKTFDCDTYLSGTSGPNYMDMGLFEMDNITVQVQELNDKRSVLEALCE